MRTSSCRNAIEGYVRENWELLIVTIALVIFIITATNMLAKILVTLAVILIHAGIIIKLIQNKNEEMRE